MALPASNTMGKVATLGAEMCVDGFMMLLFLYFIPFTSGFAQNACSIVFIASQPYMSVGYGLWVIGTRKMEPPRKGNAYTSVVGWIPMAYLLLSFSKFDPFVESLLGSRIRLFAPGSTSDDERPASMELHMFLILCGCIVRYIILPHTMRNSAWDISVRLGCAVIATLVIFVRFFRLGSLLLLTEPIVILDFVLTNMFDETIAILKTASYTRVAEVLEGLSA
jgi:hypothetical protein